jgi:hypothetical protein
MWWLGTARANWEQVFGPRVWTWFCESCSLTPLRYPVISYVARRVVTDEELFMFISPDWVDEG